jgi:cytochrome c-type biogenesis protein CcmH/NrfG
MAYGIVEGCERYVRVNPPGESVSQPRKRPTSPNPKRRRQQPSVKRSQRIYAILGVIIAFSLIATVIGPPIIDFLTQVDEEPTIQLNDDSSDPIVEQMLAEIEAQPNNAESLAALGNYLGNTGQVDEAIAWYEKALEIAPDNWDIRLGFARVLANGAKRADAELQFKKVIEANPDDPQAHFSLAQLYANWVPPRTAEAILEYQKVIEVGPDTFVAERAAEELLQLGGASPVAGTPVSSPVASPVSTEVGS